MGHSPTTKGQLRAWHWHTGQPHSSANDTSRQWHIEVLARRLDEDANFRDTVRHPDRVETVYAGGEKATALCFDALLDGTWKVSLQETTQRKTKIWVNLCYERNFRMAVERACNKLNPMGSHGHSYTTACAELTRSGKMIDPVAIWKYKDAERALKEASNALACEVTGYFEQVPDAKTNRSYLNELADELPKNWVGQRRFYEMLERLEDLNPTVRQPVKRRGKEDDSQTEGWMQVIRPSKT